MTKSKDAKLRLRREESLIMEESKWSCECKHDNKDNKESIRGVDDKHRERDGEKKRRRGVDHYTVGDREKSRSPRHWDSDVDNQNDERKQDMEEEDRRPDKEMEKRRRRVREWLELKRKKEPKAGKNWTLEGESDDEEVSLVKESVSYMDMDGVSKSLTEAEVIIMAVDSETRNGLTNAGVFTSIEEEIDPLDAFMNSIVLPEVDKLNSDLLAAENAELNGKDNTCMSKKMTKKSLGRIMPEDSDSDSDYEDQAGGRINVGDEDDDEFVKRVKKTKVDKIAIVDHSTIDYIEFRKNFYKEVNEIQSITPEEVAACRKDLELKVKGKDVPKPVKTWHQIGLTTKILEVIRKLGFEKPMPIQAQALPIIMSGRDCIGIAKTGTGKTLAFVLPMLRHIMYQPPLMSGDGPIGLIMAPTRELVQQIHNDIKKFAKVLNLTCVPVYGGSGVAQQIGDLKKGAEIVVCTAGRMIDMLCTSSGKVTNLRRVTFLVMDEADRLFDMGFEPQISKIIQNIRPDRQTVLFSATFPSHVEVLAKKVLNKAVEVQVGGRSVVNRDITQMVEVRLESERFFRLLEILGEWCKKGKILIFVNTQDKCDALFRNLLKSAYPCLSLHGAKDQGDRESTIADFKSNVCNLLIATSIAARGLDVKDLNLVVNFDVPSHYEEYVHRVGRTGRAGRNGYAITFISEVEARYAPAIVKALEFSEQDVPQDLKALADGFTEKVKQGIEQPHGTGYGGKCYQFNEREDEAWKAARKAQAKEHGFEFDKSDSEDEDDEVCKRTDVTETTLVYGGQVLSNTPVPATSSILSINSVAMKNIAKLQQEAMPKHYKAELEINDFPLNVRMKMCKETFDRVFDQTGAKISFKGKFYPSRLIMDPGERKLYLLIEGHSECSVKAAKAELKMVLEDITRQSQRLTNQ